MKCKNCGNEMHIFNEQSYPSFEDWQPQMYICDECNNIQYETCMFFVWRHWKKKFS